jgi:DNA-binding GntR family transcriptional regulator
MVESTPHLNREDASDGVRSARPGLQSLNLESVPALVAERVRSGILDGTFPPGSQLAEVDLASQLGVSRGPVREALQRLIHEGLAQAERNRGVFVVDLDVSDARDVYFVREVIEQTAAAGLAESLDEAALAGLSEVVERMERMTDAPWGKLVETDLEFHRRLVASAGSPRLNRIFTTLGAETRLCLMYLERFYPDRAELVIEHRDLVDAIRAGDPVRLTATVQDHMVAARRRIEGEDPAADPAEPAEVS